MKKIKILFAEDHELVQNGIKLMLDKQNKFKAEIDTVKTGNEAIKMALSKSYDVILLDINIPEKTGLEVTKILTKKLPGIRILALTSHNEHFIIKQMVEAGVLGYILKNSGIEELTNAIDTVNSYKRYYSNEVAQILINSSSTTSAVQKDAQKKKMPLLQNISPREMQVLKFITQELTTNEIAKCLSISPRTAANHRNNLLQKLDVKNSIGLAKFAIQNGLA
ncbi:response regulator transcription factor [Flavobacteriales bacterium]|nr:response regulator transcription factor [Flavobacteriales bacterium]